jgi:hypothetical protein
VCLRTVHHSLERIEKRWPDGGAGQEATDNSVPSNRAGLIAASISSDVELLLDRAQDAVNHHIVDEGAAPCELGIKCDVVPPTLCPASDRGRWAQPLPAASTLEPEPFLDILDLPMNPHRAQPQRMTVSTASPIPWLP